MRALLRRHLLPIQAHFEFSLVLTYAFPQELLVPLLPPGLSVDTYEGLGFLAIAMVQTRELRPTFIPKVLGQRFFLTGYRIFVRYQTVTGRRLRGLYILRSDTDQASMVLLGNLLTHYGYYKAEVYCSRIDQMLTVAVKTPQAKADVRVVADLSSRPASLPMASPFPDLRAARRFVGPLPFTFSYESETQSMLRVEGVRENWKPEPVHVDVVQATFLHQSPFNQFPEPKLANAFYLEGIPYRWKRGILEEVRETVCPLRAERSQYA
jgi:uncharacterized protein YqjF (DUF2071 family)